jgi:hypothetical protein
MIWGDRVLELNQGNTSAQLKRFFVELSIFVQTQISVLVTTDTYFDKHSGVESRQNKVL